MPYHWHTYFEVIRIIFGTFHLTLDNETKEYRQGDIIFITSGMLHGGGGEDCVYESVVFDLQILMKPNHACTRALQDVMDQKIIVNTLLSERSAAVSTIVRDLCLALSCRRTGSEFMIQGYLYQLFGVIFEERLYEECPSESAASGRLYSIKKVLAYISESGLPGENRRHESQVFLSVLPQYDRPHAHQLPQLLPDRMRVRDAGQTECLDQAGRRFLRLQRRELFH